MDNGKEQSGAEYDGGAEDISTLQEQGNPFEDGPECFDKMTRWSFRDRHNARHIKNILPVEKTSSVLILSCAYA